MIALAFPPLTPTERSAVKRKARYRGLVAESSNEERGTLANYGGFRLRKGNRVIAGGRFNLSFEEAIEALDDTSIGEHA